jgi:thioredoxin 2
MSTIVACPACHRRNRVGDVPRGVPRCAACRAMLPWIVAADDDGFAPAVTSSVPVLVDFWAPWCGPCRRLSPVVESLAAEHAGAVKLVRVNVDDAPDVSDGHRVLGIPHLILLRDGREVARIAGARSHDELAAWLAPHLG